MLVITILTLIACVCLIGFEKVKVASSHKENKKMHDPLFIIGAAALVACWIYMAGRYWNYDGIWIISYGVRVTLGIIAVLAALGYYVYLLFFALPKGTYSGEELQTHLVQTGAYSRCRHPGFYGFTLTAAAMSLLVGNATNALLLLVYVILNLVYIILEDVIYFPAYIEGYDEYKKRVPFLAFWK